MRGEWLNYVASGIVMVWGVSHVVPTTAVVKGFGDISVDNRRIITMEWVAEGLALIFIGVLTLAVTLAVGLTDPVAVLVYRLSAAALAVFAVWTFIAGFQTSIVPIKLCPFVLSTAAGLLVVATMI